MFSARQEMTWCTDAVPSRVRRAITKLERSHTSSTDRNYEKQPDTFRHFITRSQGVDLLHLCYNTSTWLPIEAISSIPQVAPSVLKANVPSAKAVFSDSFYRTAWKSLSAHDITMAVRNNAAKRDFSAAAKSCRDVFLDYTKLSPPLYFRTTRPINRMVLFLSINL